MLIIDLRLYAVRVNNRNKKDTKRRIISVDKLNTEHE